MPILLEETKEDEVGQETYFRTESHSLKGKPVVMPQPDELSSWHNPRWLSYAKRFLVPAVILIGILAVCNHKRLPQEKYQPREIHSFEFETDGRHMVSGSSVAWKR